MHFDVSDAFRPFAEGKFVHIFSRQEGQPSFFQGSFGGFFGQGNGIRCDNAYLSAQNLAVLQSQGYCSGGATFAGIVPVNRFDVDFGGRSELVTRDTWRVVAGVQGDFNDDWNYEVSFNYGHVKIHQDELNDLIIDDPFNGFADDGFLLAVDAVRNAQGQIVCRVNQAAVTRPDCVPINVFGSGAPTQAALDFVNTTSYVDSSASEYDAVAFVNGDSSQLFSFPGGPARFVIGGEWRRETAFLEADPLSANFGTFFNAFATFDPPALTVKEVFGELELPLLRDLPFAQELTITGAARYSDYNTSANHTFAWNINGTWAPFATSASGELLTIGSRPDPVRSVHPRRPEFRVRRGSVRRPEHRADRRQPAGQLRLAGHPGRLHQHAGAVADDRLPVRGQSVPQRRNLEEPHAGRRAHPRAGCRASA